MYSSIYDPVFYAGSEPLNDPQVYKSMKKLTTTAAPVIITDRLGQTKLAVCRTSQSVSQSVLTTDEQLVFLRAFNLDDSQIILLKINPFSM